MSIPTRVAILGLDPVQHEWLAAVDFLRAAGEITLVGVGHRSLALAKDVADQFPVQRPPAFDDLRLFLKDAAPQVILLDRPSNVGMDFLTACFAQGIAILSLGPPVEKFAEAAELADSLEPRTHLLYVWPRLTDAFGFRHGTQAEDFVKPIRFAAATWLGMNHALAKAVAAERCASAAGTGNISIRSLSVLAWDALATLIELLGIPTTVYASIRGTVGSGDIFGDLSGACAMTLRFAEDGVASVTVSDRIAGAGRRDLLLLGQAGTVKLQADAYELRDADGQLVDSGGAAQCAGAEAAVAGAGGAALDTLRVFLQHFNQADSPMRGWEHRLREVAATMEALVVSHRTGQAESPERFQLLRR